MSDPRGGPAGSATQAGPTHPELSTSAHDQGAGDAAMPDDSTAELAALDEPTAELPAPDEPAAEHGPDPVDLPGDAPEEPADGALDASAHAHVLEDPLQPPDDEVDPPLFAAVRSGGLEATSAPPGATTAPADADDAGAGSTAGPLGGVADGSSPGSARHTRAEPARVPWRRRRGVRIAVGTVLGLALAGSIGLGSYLYVSATAWRDRAGGYLDESLDLGEDLSRTRGDLAGAQAELDAVRAQLATAHQRITELASEKAQISDDWEITQQLVDYQERVSDAAGKVALALDQCVQSQQELIGYLARAAEQTTGPTATPAPYDPAQLAQFESDVEAFCQKASEANISLQQELAR